MIAPLFSAGQGVCFPRLKLLKPLHSFEKLITNTCCVSEHLTWVYSAAY